MAVKWTCAMLPLCHLTSRTNSAWHVAIPGNVCMRWVGRSWLDWIQLERCQSWVLMQHWQHCVTQFWQQFASMAPHWPTHCPTPQPGEVTEKCRTQALFSCRTSYWGATTLTPLLWKNTLGWWGTCLRWRDTLSTLHTSCPVSLSVTYTSFHPKLLNGSNIERLPHAVVSSGF